MKTAFITGGGKGLGKGFAKFFLKQGFQVFIGVLSQKEVDSELAKEKNLAIIKMDVSSDESIKAAFKEVQKKTDHIDFLINNAGLNKDFLKTYSAQHWHISKDGTIEVTFFETKQILLVAVRKNRRGKWAGVSYKNLVAFLRKNI